ncbi:MAG: hypothetical protein R3C14_47225 [Caldilineaceae bacterium]
MIKIDTAYLSIDEAIRKVRQDPGFIPVAIDSTGVEHNVVWLNVGDYQFTESKFRYSIQNLATQPKPGERIVTDIRMLAADDFLAQTLYPSGFIFHISRCGSTLLAKALARAPQHIVIDEGTPLNDGLWHYFTQGWQHQVAETTENISLLRNLVLALGRKRALEHQHYFVKFRSWNVVFLDFITRVFPDVPCLFLYRDPVEVLASADMRPVWVLDFKGLPSGAFLADVPLARTITMSDVDFLTDLFSRYFLTALQATSNQLAYLNYDQILAQNLAPILHHAFNFSTTPATLQGMLTQFDYYSKDDSDTVRFISDKALKQQAATAEIRAAVAHRLDALYTQVERSPKNLAGRL